MGNGERLARIEQKLTDFMELYQNDRKENGAKFKDLDTLKRKFDRVETPLKWAAGVVSMSLVGTFGFIGEHAIKWTIGALHAGRHLSK